MAETATAVNDTATTATTDSAPADMSVHDLAAQPFDMDDSDFTDDAAAEDDSEVAPNESDEPVKTPDGDDNETDSEGDEVKDESEVTDDSDESEPTKGEKRKDDLNTEIRDLVAKRNELRKAVEEETAKAYQAQSIDELREEGLSDTDAKVEAMRQQMEIDKYNTQVAEAQLIIDSEASRVLRDFTLFDADNKDSYNKDLAASAASLMDLNYIKDENSQQVVGQHLPTYEFYKLINDAFTLGKTNGELSGKKNAARQSARVDTVSSSGPKSSKKDSGMDAFEAEMDRY